MVSVPLWFNIFSFSKFSEKSLIFFCRIRIKNYLCSPKPGKYLKWPVRPSDAEALAKAKTGQIYEIWPVRPSDAEALAKAKIGRIFEIHGPFVHRTPKL
jgi:hypothetical protein